MVKLRKILSDSSKLARHRRHLLNIQITFISWIIETFAFFVGLITFLITNHENIIQRFILTHLSISVYVIILPCVTLMNDSDIKEEVANSTWYIMLLDIFNYKYKGPMASDESTNEDNGAIKENHENEDGNNRTNENSENQNIIDNPKELGHEESKTEVKDNSNTNEETVNTLTNCTTSKDNTVNAFKVPF